MIYNNELKIVVPKGWSVRVEERSDGSRVFKFAQENAEDTTCHHQEDIFKLVRASELSLSDGFLRYRPHTRAEKAFKEALEKVIKAGVQDFYRPTLDPSFDVDGRICYEVDMKPAVGKSYNWWVKASKDFCPERKSRLGTYSEHIAFLAVLIKEMVASGKSLEWAWNAVCNDSKELGHYWNSSDAKHEFEATCKRKVCGWSDLANTCKILAKDKEAGGFWLAGGCYCDFSDVSPLAGLCHCGNRDDDERNSTGWLVLS